jgi:uncharacterized protein YndB with AHSA1/START domain
VSACGGPARYEIRVAGVLDGRWAAWFDGLQISGQGEETVICVLVADQPALHGLLTKVRDLGLCLISVRRLDTGLCPAPSGQQARGDPPGGPAAIGHHTGSLARTHGQTRVISKLEEDMTEFLGTDGGQVAGEVTGLTAVAEEVVAARPELVWDLVADITRVGGWSPECIRAAWLTEPGRPQPGARFTGRNRFGNGFEYEVTCVVTEADRPRAFAWVVLDDSGDPARPSSLWRYRIDPLPGGGSRVRQRFTHGPGTSFLREVAAEAPDQAAGIIAARRDGLRANMRATLRAMKAAAESSHASGAGAG